MTGIWTTTKVILITVSLHLATNAVWAESSTTESQSKEEIRKRDKAEAERDASRERQETERDAAREKHEAEQDATRERHAAAEEALTKLNAELEGTQEDIRHLRMMQIDLQAEIEHASMDQKQDKAASLQRELVDIQHQLQRRQLDMERVQMERDRHLEQRELMRMTDRFEYVANWQEVAFEPSRAIMMATQGLVELNMANHAPEKAAERLEDLLKQLKEPGCRTAVRFALKDVYIQLGETGKAEDQMTKIVLENAAALRGGSSE